MERPDDDLLHAWVSGGDIAAFEELYDRHEQSVLRFLFSLGESREYAEDVLQSVWIKIMERAGHYEARGRFRPWLFRLAWTTRADLRKQAWERKRVREKEEDAGWNAVSNEPSPREKLMENERRSIVDDALMELPDAMRETLLLRIDGDLSFREIAETMGCPLGTALWRANEGEKRLRTIVGARVEA